MQTNMLRGENMAKLKTIEDIDFKNKKVIIRVDYNVPLDKKGNIEDDFRIKQTVPTINHILSKMPTQLILMTHIGRPEHNEPELKTDNVAKRLGELINMPIKKVDGWNTVSCSKNDCIVMLENLRFNPAEQSEDEKEKDKFGKKLASLADIYVNDAFSNCHRDDASMTSVPKFLKGNSCIGLLVKKELDMIKANIDNPKRPFVSIIGGVKADKLTAIDNLTKKADKILLGGALAFLFHHVAGHEVGKTKIDKDIKPETVEKIKAYMKNPKIMLPKDAVVAESTEIKDAKKIKHVAFDKIPNNMMALDIGPETVKEYSKVLKEAKTIAWNGPVGFFENQLFAKGTIGIADAIAEATKKGAVSFVGGGDSAAALEKLGFAKKISFISSGGGASLKLFEGKELVALKALER